MKFSSTESGKSKRNDESNQAGRSKKKNKMI